MEDELIESCLIMYPHITDLVLETGAVVISAVDGHGSRDEKMSRWEGATGNAG